jgi:hypothetical protein
MSKQTDHIYIKTPDSPENKNPVKRLGKRDFPNEAPSRSDDLSQLELTGIMAGIPRYASIVRDLLVKMYGVPSKPTKLALAVRHELGRFRAQAVCRGDAR